MTFSDYERQAFAKLADELIPVGERMPSASQADVSGEWLDAVLTARPDLAGPLKQLISKVGATAPVDFVHELRATDPDAFGILAEVVPAAYFMNPDVRRAIGYSGQEGREIDPRPDYMDNGLLESVIRRGPIYRPTPER